MIGAIAAWFMSAGLPQRRARQLAVGLLIIAAILLLWLGKALYDRAVIRRHETGQAAATAQADRAADAKAATQRRADDARLEAEADALERITDNEVDATVDPLAARRAYYSCVRLQQQARARGDVTPACR
ncbi:hypothetical protein [Sphingobium ummariense]|uniref:Uncharacterized protein n=1 Tax=Sphingobium ummariense RL-3 TaxID=1346791 RepID=T0J5B2_9SPHN|nr:hypothetical protein [Sphingobium ummariense]EQB32027.1 hypothetical protein M529_11825 [Sphingobium ummariense RL-3]